MAARDCYHTVVVITSISVYTAGVVHYDAIKRRAAWTHIRIHSLSDFQYRLRRATDRGVLGVF